MGCEHMLDVLKNRIQVEITEFEDRKKSRFESTSKDIPLLLVKAEAHKNSMNKLLDYIDAYRSELIDECESKQRRKYTGPEITDKEAIAGLNALFGLSTPMPKHDSILDQD
jgi:hypothetical protein